MAGIGFSLEKYLKKNSYLGLVQAHLYSAFIGAGPWLICTITLFALSNWSPGTLDRYEIVFFRTTINYVFIFSLVTTGFLYLSVSRHLADRLFLKEDTAVIPILNSCLAIVIPVQAVTAGIFFSFVTHNVPIRLWVTMIYVVVSCMWVLMMFLTALRDFKTISCVFVAGAFITFGAAYFFGYWFGLPGYFFGYLLGHLLIVLALSARVFIEFASKRVFDESVFTFLANNKALVLTGFIYNVALWVDKFVMWGSPRSITVAYGYYSYPQYEASTFFAFLTIIPSISIFLISVETDFYRAYRNYFSQILEQGTLGGVLKAKSEMGKSLRDSCRTMIIYQGVISFLAIIFAVEIINFFHLPTVSVPVFRITALGAFIFSLLLITLTIILYFDLKKLALYVSIVFLATNWFFTWVTVYLPIGYEGFGYFAATIVTLAFAYYALDFNFKNFEFITFSRQPVSPHPE
ncbi:MAG TPA: exopolysaccharide Pel transporter PelG [bacterium]|nr:exopolysaccharide Pel transporter PelG [bacterium]